MGRKIAVILYDENNNLLGISSDTIRFLGYDDMDDFKTYANDVADLFVKKSGYIYKFDNFSWIDYVLHSGAAKKSAFIKLKSGKEVEVNVSIKEILLPNSLESINTMYEIDLSISTSDEGEEEETPAQNGFKANISSNEAEFEDYSEYFDDGFYANKSQKETTPKPTITKEQEKKATIKAIDEEFALKQQAEQEARKQEILALEIEAEKKVREKNRSKIDLAQEDPIDTKPTEAKEQIQTIQQVEPTELVKLVEPVKEPKVVVEKPIKPTKEVVQPIEQLEPIQPIEEPKTEEPKIIEEPAKAIEPAEEIKATEEVKIVEKPIKIVEPIEEPKIIQEPVKESKEEIKETKTAIQKEDNVETKIPKVDVVEEKIEEIKQPQEIETLKIEPQIIRDNELITTEIAKVPPQKSDEELKQESLGKVTIEEKPTKDDKSDSEDDTFLKEHALPKKQEPQPISINLDKGAKALGFDYEQMNKFIKEYINYTDELNERFISAVSMYDIGTIRRFSLCLKSIADILRIDELSIPLTKLYNANMEEVSILFYKYQKTHEDIKKAFK